MPACSSTKPARMRLMKASHGSASTSASGMTTSRICTANVRVPSSATNRVLAARLTPAAAHGTIAMTKCLGASSTSKTAPKWWSAPRLDTNGKQAAHDVAAVDPPALEPHRLDPEEGLHRVRQRGAAEHLAGRHPGAETRFQAIVAGREDVPAERVLAPHAERRRQAVLAGRRHGADCRHHVDSGRLTRQMATERPRPAE